MKYEIGDIVIWKRDGVRGVVVNVNKRGAFEVEWSDSKSVDGYADEDTDNVILDIEFRWYRDIIKL